jgi:hypothetical protein
VTRRVDGLGTAPAEKAPRVDEVVEALTVLEAYNYAQKKDFEEKMGRRVAEIDAELAELKAAIPEIQEAGAVKWYQTLRDLERQRRALGTKADRANQATEESWEELRNGASSALGELEKSLRSAYKKLEAAGHQTPGDDRRGIPS